MTHTPPDRQLSYIVSGIRGVFSENLAYGERRLLISNLNLRDPACEAAKQLMPLSLYFPSDEILKQMAREQEINSRGTVWRR